MNQDGLEGTHLYQRIAGEIRNKILNGDYRPGDRLPTIRELKRQWNCTQGTIQRAYKELAQQGLITSWAGKGTHVVNPLDNGNLQISKPLRKAKLVHKAESFLLESLIAGYSFEEIQESIDLARRHLQTF
jgi:DNA-binding GntR family transcriptional regulator